MTHRPFDPSELDQPTTDTRRAVAEIESYLADTATVAPRGLGQGVVAAIEREPAPRRGFLSWLMMPSGLNNRARRVARAGLLAATLVIAIAGAILAGQLTGMIRNVGSGSPTPVESVSPAPSESVGPSPRISPSSSPKQSEGAHESPGASGGPGSSEAEVPGGSVDESSNESTGPSSSQAE
jgi:hypothetical protein